MIQECLTSVSGHLKTWLEISLGANQRKESSSLPLLDPDQVVELQLFAEWIQTDKGSIAYFVLKITSDFFQGCSVFISNKLTNQGFFGRLLKNKNHIYV